MCTKQKNRLICGENSVQNSAAYYLTPRQQEVLKLMSLGITSTKELARELGIRPATIKRHVEEILSKLDVEDRTQAVLVAIKYHLTEANPGTIVRRKAE
jgi:DNA-binding NarL/FixJ family response regulator